MRVNRTRIYNALWKPLFLLCQDVGSPERVTRIGPASAATTWTQYRYCAASTSVISRAAFATATLGCPGLTRKFERKRTD
jgi:hypothetical protein